MPYTKEQQSEISKKWYEKNKENKKEYNEKNKENKKEYDKEYYDKNKEKKKEYYEKNKEKINIQRKEYEKTESGKKNRFKTRYKMLVNCDLDILYKNYLAETHCDFCCMPFTEPNHLKYGNKYVKCLDHDHETNEFRNFLCLSCNVKRG